MEENGTNGEVDLDHGPVEVKGPSIQSPLTARKVIQLKIDNPLLTNGISNVELYYLAI